MLPRRPLRSAHRFAVPRQAGNETSGQCGRREVGHRGAGPPSGPERFRFQSLGPPQFMDDLGKAASLDVLHRVERHAPLGADGEDRHDVVVVQAGSGLGFELEPLELAGVERRGHGEDLERHAAVQRTLLGLVHDPHAAPADLADDPVIAEDPGQEIGAALSLDDTSGMLGRRRAEVDQGLERREKPSELVGVLRVLEGQRRDIHRIARLEAFDDFIAKLRQRRVGRGRRQDIVRSGLHRSSSRSSSKFRQRTTARINRDLTAPSPISRTAAVSAVESCSRNRSTRTSRSRGVSPSSAARTRSRVSSRIACRLGLVPLAISRFASIMAD